VPIRTLQELSDQTRRLSDTENKDLRHTVAVVTYELNQSLQRLQEIVSRNGHSYYMVSTVTLGAVLPTVGSPEQIFTPGGGGRFYSIILNEGQEFWQLDDFPDSERAFWRAQPNGRPQVFRMIESVVGTVNVIEMYPAPDKAYGVEVWILPEFIPLANPADEFSDHFGWSEWATNDAAQKLCQKDNDRDRFAMCAQKKVELEAEIARMAPKQQRVRVPRRRNTRLHRLADLAAGRKFWGI
jgi:hypothetical protein